MAAADWVALSDGSPRDTDRSLSPRRLFTGVIAIAVVVVVAVGLVSVLVARALAESGAVADAANRADVIAESQVQPTLQDGLLRGDPVALAAMDEMVRGHVLGPAIIRVKIWDDRGRIVY